MIPRTSSVEGMDQPAYLPPTGDGQPDVGRFEHGTPGSRWALGRYLVGRVIAEYVSRVLLIFALAVLVLAGVVGWLGPTWAAVLIVLFGASVLLLRWLLVAVLRRLTAARHFGPYESELRRLVAATHGDVRTELRRIGVPSRRWTLPLLGLRLARPRHRAKTLARLRQFEVERAVPVARLDQLHMIVSQLSRR